MANKKNTVTIDVTEIFNKVNDVKPSDYTKVYQITYEINKIGLLGRAKAWVKKLFKKYFTFDSQKVKGSKILFERINFFQKIISFYERCPFR